jgi:hypothetical protein
MPVFSERYEVEFKQFMLLCTNFIWLALEWCWLDTESEVIFAISRFAYFFFIGAMRAEGAF